MIQWNQEPRNDRPVGPHGTPEERRTTGLVITAFSLLVLSVPAIFALIASIASSTPARLFGAYEVSLAGLFATFGLFVGLPIGLFLLSERRRR